MRFSLKQARQYAELTQKEMADKLNVSLATYRAYEIGDRQMKVDKAERFSKIVGIDFNQLIFLQTN